MIINFNKTIALGNLYKIVLTTSKVPTFTRKRGYDMPEEVVGKIPLLYNFNAKNINADTRYTYMLFARDCLCGQVEWQLSDSASAIKVLFYIVRYPIQSIRWVLSCYHR